MDKLFNLLAWVALEVAGLMSAPTQKDIEEFNKQQPETKPSRPAFIVYLASIAALLIIPIGFLILAFAV